MRRFALLKGYQDQKLHIQALQSEVDHAKHFSPPSNEDDECEQPLLAMDQVDDLADEDAMPYEIVSQGRTTEAMGSRVKYQMRIINNEPCSKNSCTWELAHELEDDPDYAKLIEDWKKRRGKHQLGRGCEHVMSILVI
jgi:hypothetical protein